MLLDIRYKIEALCFNYLKHYMYLKITYRDRLLKKLWTLDVQTPVSILCNTLQSIFQIAQAQSLIFIMSTREETNSMNEIKSGQFVRHTVG